MMKTQFLCFGLKEDQRYLQHVNVMNRILITNSYRVSTVTSVTINQQSIQPEVVRAVAGTPHLYFGIWRESGAGLCQEIPGCRLQALDAGYLNIIIVQVYCILL